MKCSLMQTMKTLMKMSPNANSEDPDEMPHKAAFHQGLHCLPKYLFTSIGNEKG